MTQFDLISLVLILSPARDVERERPLPGWWGKGVHGLMMRVIQEGDPALSAAIHESNEATPFTTSSLIGRFPNRALDMSGEYKLRLTGLRGDISKLLLDAAQSGGSLAPGSSITLDQFPFIIKAAHWQPDSHELASSESYQAMAAGPLLAAQQPERTIRMRFFSPTNFSSKQRLSQNGQNIPFPLPDFVFGSLLQRWNAFSSVAFPAELRRYASECLHISRFEISSRSVLVGGGVQVGMTGQVTFRAHHYDRYWMSIVHVLAAFAFYAGVGAKTGMGLGQCSAFPSEDNNEKS